MLMHNVKTVWTKSRIKISSILKDMVKIAATIQKIVESLRNSVLKMQNGICRMSKIYEDLNYTFPN